MSRGRTIELRFLSDNQGNKFNNWALIEQMANHVKADYRFNSIYIDSYDQMKEILLYKIGKFPATRLYNIFIGVNPRRKVFVKSKNKLLYKSFYGGIAGTSHIQNILADIEFKDRTGTATEAEIEECIQGAKFLVKELEVEDYYINVSGNGAHLWMRLEEPIELPIPEFAEFEDKIKYKLKDGEIRKWIKAYNKFIEQLDVIIQKYNPKIKVDEGAKDLSRVARAPGSWNVKAGKKARAVGTVYLNNIKGIILNHKFMSVIPLLTEDTKKVLKNAEITNRHRYNRMNLEGCPLYNLLISRLLPSTLSRNHYLEQSFARILRDNDIKINEVNMLVDRMSEVQEKNIQCDPDYLDDEEPFNSEMVNSYCLASKIDLVYPLLESVPQVQKNTIDEQRYKILNNYSWLTVEKLALKEIPKPKSYMDLKELIRKLCDSYDKTTVFFTIKMLYKEEWDYYDRNRVLQQLLNKTRKRED
jgi:hypothetical protein